LSVIIHICNLSFNGHLSSATSTMNDENDGNAKYLIKTKQGLMLLLRKKPIFLAFNTDKYRKNFSSTPWAYFHEMA